MPAIGATTVASAMAFFERGDLRVGGRDARAGGVDLLAAGAGAQPRHASVRRRTRSRAGLTPRFSRHVPSRHRIVALLARARVRCEQRFEALRRRLLPPRARRCGRGTSACGGRDLRLGLADVLGARAGEQQPQLRVGLIAIGPRALSASSASRCRAWR